MLSVKMREHLRRRAEVYGVKLGVLAGILLALCGAVGWTARGTRVVEISDNEGAFGQAILSAADVQDIWTRTGVAPPGEYDELSAETTPQGESYRILRAYPVTVTADGATTEKMITGGTVDELLAQMGITYDADDELTPAGTEPAAKGTAVTLRRIEYREYTQEETIPVETEYLDTSIYFHGRFQGITRQVRTGHDGKDSVTYRERYVDGELESTAEIARETLEPMLTTVIKRYQSGAPVSHFVGPEIVNGSPAEGIAAVYSNCRATGYSAGAGARGASGRRLTYGTVAIDPNIIPYGSLMYIRAHSGENFVYGYAYAADTGIAMMDGRAFVDLYYETYDESVKNEVVYVDIYVLDKATAARYKEQNDALLAADHTVGM